MSRENNLFPFALRRTIARVRRLRQQVRTEQALGALPEYIQKDIGWPDRFAEQRARADF
ncbi:MAG: hypothetical protein AB7P20_18655 [Rhizobiaceae bacterium]